MTTASDWSGKVGDVWAAEWRRTDRSFATLSRQLDAAILAAAPAHGVALDIGCGAGGTSIALASARPDLDVVGVDLSAELVGVARTRAAGIANVRFVVGDGGGALDDLPSPSLICSRHGVMFFADSAATFAAFCRAASPGAPLVFSCFRAAALNPWASALVAVVTGETPTPATCYAPGPFGFADERWVETMLADAGWQGVTGEPVDYRYVAGAGDDPVEDAVSFFRRIGSIAGALRDAPETARAAMLDKLRDALHKHREHDEIVFPAAAWIWRARAPGDQR
ncbi:class I SAM-dependent methyltransferase [Sphingomonas oligophenolica]|uniref:Class I SAM-dependent methyltransferase n=1 Tax=Sphingomonas oligophenolica TaxID=301154 RepID=A0A502CHC2_9SPHN|nr:class I SAM-dependent methyltransferase [Sphingomonas oligophenolica]